MLDIKTNNNALLVQYINFKFSYSGKQSHVSLMIIKSKVIEFLDKYSASNILDKNFLNVIGGGNGEQKLATLIGATGFQKGYDFFQSIIKSLEGSNHLNPINISFNGINIPYLLCLSILEVLVPGDGFITINNVGELEEACNFNVPLSERDDLQKVIETYPVRLSMHIIRQMRLSKHIAYQYLPFVDELHNEGLKNTWVGQFHKGLLEQMYQNRPIFVLNMSCPVYCRFCFRKHKDCRNQKAPNVDDVSQAVDYIQNNHNIKEVVLTGGDPFMNPATMKCAVNGLKKIPHVKTLRIATRSISYYPNLLLGDNRHWLDYLIKTNRDLNVLGKRIEIATHFIHPDEISVQSLDIITQLVKNGVVVYVQTPFLNNCNDDGSQLKDLYSVLRGAGVEIHYVYIPCSPIQGNRVYSTTLSKGIAVGNYLRGNLTDRAVPHMCTATSVGKIDWNTSGWVVEKADEKHIWIRTSFTEDYFKQFSEDFKLENARINEEGTIDVKYMADVGNKNLFYGSRKKTNRSKSISSLEKLKSAQKLLNNDAIKPMGGIMKSKTRVELDINCFDNDNILDVIGQNRNVTDVVLFSRQEILLDLIKLKSIVLKLHEIDHINAIRLRSFSFASNPGIYNDEVIQLLGYLNKLSVSNPKRLEVESWFLHGSEFSKLHNRIITDLRNLGVTVYVNSMLLNGVNNSSEDILGISYACREFGLEFNNLYISGLNLQDQFNDVPVIDQDVIGIASSLRRSGSGRELPHYIACLAGVEINYSIFN